MVGMTDDAAQAQAQVLKDMVIDQFGRIRSLVQQSTDGLPDEVAVWRPDPDANSIAWLVWHLARVQDDHLANLAGVEQAWTAQGWYQRFDLPFPADSFGFGQSSDEVAQVQAPVTLLADYHADVHTLSLNYAQGLTADSLATVVDTNWDPPVTASARLVSLIGDCLQHLGQVAYVRGMAERADIG